MKEITSTSALPTDTLHHGGSLACVSLPYTTSSCAFPKTRMDHEGNPTHASILSITSTNTFPINTLHHEGSLVVRNFLLRQAQVHCQKQHFTMKEI
jgi:hypothetical protein